MLFKIVFPGSFPPAIPIIQYSHQHTSFVIEVADLDQLLAFIGKLEGHSASVSVSSPAESPVIHLSKMTTRECSELPVYKNLGAQNDSRANS